MEERDRFNKEAGNILVLAEKFAEEAKKFVENSPDNIFDTNEIYSSPEARVYFLQLKWYQLWSAAVDDLRFRAWIYGGPGG